MYDVIIIGTGPAGYSAALYAARYQLKTLVLGQQDGGMTAWAHIIENYPSVEAIPGFELMQKFRHHAEKFGVEIKQSKIKNIVQTEHGFKVENERGEIIEGKSLVLCTGTTRRKLNVPGEQELFGKGVSYCTTCDGLFFRDKIITIIGGGDSALTGALYLGNVARKLYLIHRRDEFRAEPVTVQKVIDHPKIEIIYSNGVEEIRGGQVVEKLKLKNPHQGSEFLETNGIFIEIGAIPSNELAKKMGVALNEEGFIKVQKNQGTNLPGVFAAGDITDGSNSFHQTVTAAAEGVIAASGVFNYLSQK